MSGIRWSAFGACTAVLAPMPAHLVIWFRPTLHHVSFLMVAALLGASSGVVVGPALERAQAAAPRRWRTLASGALGLGGGALWGSAVASGAAILLWVATGFGHVPVDRFLSPVPGTIAFARVAALLGGMTGALQVGWFLAATSSVAKGQYPDLPLVACGALASGTVTEASMLWWVVAFTG